MEKQTTWSVKMEEKPMTKKEFKELHSNGKLRLVQGMVNMSKNKLIAHLEQITNELSFPNGTNTTNVNINNDGDYCKVELFKGTVNNIPVILVSFEIDNSACPNCSWSDMEYKTMLYRIAKEN